MSDQQSQPTQKPNQTIWIILVVVILAVAVYGIWTALSNSNTDNNTNTNTTVNQNANLNKNTNSAVNTNINTNANDNNANTNSSVIDTNDWKTYTNEAFGYSVEYPDDWEVIESTSMVTNLKPKERSYLFEGGAAYPIVITGYTDDVNNYLSQISADSKSQVIINNQQATKVIGYFNSESYVMPHSDSQGFIVIGSNAKEIFNGGNIDETEKNDLENIFDSILEIFELN